MSDEENILNRNEVLNIINQISSNENNKLGYEEIRSLVSELANEGIYQTYSLPTKLLIHRARHLENPRNDKEQFTLKDLGPPKPEETFDYGRCNQPNRPVCYCSLV